MKPDQFKRPLALALLCTLALSLSAATLTSPTVTGGDSGESVLADRDSPGETNTEVESDSDDSPTFTTIAETDSSVLCGESAGEIPPILVVLVGVLFALVVAGVLLEMEWAVSFAAVSLGLALIVVLVVTLGCGGLPFTEDSPSQAATDTGGDTQQAVEGTGPGDGGETGIPDSQLLLLVAAGAALILLLTLLVRSRRRGESSPLFEFGTRTSDEPRTRIGRVAGETADDIDANASLENSVYRAWAEMAAVLDVDRPETSTPAEFAESARDAGLDPEDVDELTALFEEVRYGTADATTVREQQAVDALRRIERTYAEED